MYVNQRMRLRKALGNTVPMPPFSARPLFLLYGDLKIGSRGVASRVTYAVHYTYTILIILLSRLLDAIMSHPPVALPTAGTGVQQCTAVRRDEHRVGRPGCAATTAIAVVCDSAAERFGRCRHDCLYIQQNTCIFS